MGDGITFVEGYNPGDLLKYTLLPDGSTEITNERTGQKIRVANPITETRHPTGTGLLTETELPMTGDLAFAETEKQKSTFREFLGEYSAHDAEVTAAMSRLLKPDGAATERGDTCTGPQTKRDRLAAQLKRELDAGVTAITHVECLRGFLISLKNYQDRNGPCLPPGMNDRLKSLLEETK